MPYYFSAKRLFRIIILLSTYSHNLSDSVTGCDTAGCSSKAIEAICDICVLVRLQHINTQRRRTPIVLLLATVGRLWPLAEIRNRPGRPESSTSLIAAVDLVEDHQVSVKSILVNCESANSTVCKKVYW